MIFYITSFVIINLLIYIKREFLIRKYNIYDVPDKQRKKHKIKASVFGGAIIQINLVFLLIFILLFDIEFPKFIENNRNLFSIFLISFLIFLVGLFDDMLLIKNRTKFLGLLLVVFLALSIDNDIHIISLKFSWVNRDILLLNFSIFFTLLCILTFMNSFNFMDGIDLLCGTYALGMFMIFFYLTKSIIFLPIIFSLILFCFLNYKKLIFFGDSGALLISFLISIFMIKIYKLDLIYTEQILILLLIPILDNLRVFFIRFINKYNILKPDNNHLHHLLNKKFNSLNTVLIIITPIFLPFILTLFNKEFFYILIFFQIMFYLSLIVKFKKL